MPGESGFDFFSSLHAGKQRLNFDVYLGKQLPFNMKCRKIISRMDWKKISRIKDFFYLTTFHHHFYTKNGHFRSRFHFDM